MALFRQFRGNRASLDAQPLHDGYAYFCVDDGTFHIDFTDADGNLYRKQINANNAETLCGMTLDELKLEITAQDAIVLHEAQSYTDNAIANIGISKDELKLEMATQDAVILHEAQSYTDNAVANLVTTAQLEATLGTYINDIDELIGGGL